MQTVLSNVILNVKAFKINYHKHTNLWLSNLRLLVDLQQTIKQKLDTGCSDANALNSYGEKKVRENNSKNSLVYLRTAVLYFVLPVHQLFTDAVIQQTRQAIYIQRKFNMAHEVVA